jgi:hypothetical protein
MTYIQLQKRKAKNCRTKYHADETVWRRKVSQIRSSPSAELQNRRASIKPLSFEREIFFYENVSSKYPENNIGLKGWKEISVTEARWPRSTATGSGDGLLLILLPSIYIESLIIDLSSQCMRIGYGFTAVENWHGSML